VSGVRYRIIKHFLHKQTAALYLELKSQVTSNVKRGQNSDAEVEARNEVEAKAKAKAKSLRPRPHVDISE